MKPPRILIIAGSDSGGGAGIQADIKTVTMLGGHAMTAITAITAQNSIGVQDVHPVPTEMVIQQISSVSTDFGIDAIKIGMIGSAQTAHAVADHLEALIGLWSAASVIVSEPQIDSRFPDRDFTRFVGQQLKDGEVDVLPIVFDPVMVATSGATLADKATIAAFERLMGMAAVITPNVPELAQLTGMAITDVESLEAAGNALARRYGCAVFAKGGHLPDQPQDDAPVVHDLLIRASGVSEYRMPRVETRHSHGTGCTLATAIATGIGRGLKLEDAIDRAEAFVAGALFNAPGFGKGHGPMGHAMGTTPFYHTLSAVDAFCKDADALAAQWGDHA